MTPARLQQDSPSSLPAVSPGDAVLGRVQHELRTPLFAIMTAAELLRQVTDTQWQWVVEILDQNAGHLKGLIDDMLLYGELARGDREIELGEVDVAAVLRECAARRKADADRKGVSVELFVPEALPPAFADERLTVAVLSQLLDNAIKFNRRGGSVEISASALYPELELRFANTGRGIEADQVDAVFDSFYQVEPIDTRTAGGLGLGLAIVRRAVESMEGRISVGRWADGRTSFVLRLPMRA